MGERRAAGAIEVAHVRRDVPALHRACKREDFEPLKKVPQNFSDGRIHASSFRAIADASGYFFRQLLEASVTNDPTVVPLYPNGSGSGIGSNFEADFGTPAASNMRSAF